MAYSNPYSSAQSNPVPQLSPLDTSHSLEAQSQLSSGHSPQFGHFTGSNGMISDSPDGKHGLKRKRSIADAAHRHTSEDSYTDDNTAHRSHSSGLNHSSGQAKGTSAAAAASQDAKKRTKTQRACDKCRTKKIRCANCCTQSKKDAHASYITGVMSCLIRTHRYAPTASSTIMIAHSSYPFRRHDSKKRDRKMTIHTNHHSLERSPTALRPIVRNIGRRCELTASSKVVFRFNC